MPASPLTRKFRVHISDSIGDVSAVLVSAQKPEAVLLLAHGAGAGMEHPFMISLAGELQSRSVSTIRYNFPFMEQGKKRPDPPAVAEKTVRRMIEATLERCPTIPLFVGGKSFGGRMSSQYLYKECPPEVRGIAFFGFPLHPAGAPATDRADHLKMIRIPMLFLQGTRDTLADLKLLQKVMKGLPSATLMTFEGADHSFKISKKQIIDVLAAMTGEWIQIIKSK